MPSKLTNARSSVETFWILGGGRFGLHAVNIIQSRVPDGRIIVIDKTPVNNLPKGVDFVQGDGVNWLEERLTVGTTETKIIPTLPLHLAVEWLQKKLTRQSSFKVFPVAIPELLLSRFPHPIRKSASQVVVSHADFLCPPHCSEPDEMCSYTRRRRPQALYRLLEKTECNGFMPCIVRSRQFYPGVGGFYPQDLWNLLKCVMSYPDTPLLVGSACKCHGIMDAVVFHKQGE